MCSKSIEKLDYHYQGDTNETVFFKMPKILFLGDEFEDLSISAKLVYMLMLDRVSLSDKNNWVDKNDKIFIYYTQAEVMKKLDFGNKKVSNLFKELEHYNLIKRVKQGYNKPDLIYVKSLASLEVTDTSFDGEFKYGRPNIEHRIDEKSEEILSLENKIKLLEKEISKPSRKLETISTVENNDFYKDLTCQNDISGDVKTTLLEMSKQQPNKNNINNNNLINNNSFILSTKELLSTNEENKGMNEGMINKQFKLNIINEMYENKELPYSFTDSEIKMNVAIKELVSYDLTQTNYRNKTIDEFYFSTYKLFTNALIKMLTNKGNMLLNGQYVTYSKVYNKLSEYISFQEDEFFNPYCHLNNLVDSAIIDYQKGSTKTEIKYPQKYMQSCIWNVLQIGDIRMQSEIKAMINDKDLIDSTIEKIKKQDNKKNTSYNLQEAQDMWSSCVPSLI